MISRILIGAVRERESLARNLPELQRTACSIGNLVEAGCLEPGRGT